MYKEKNEDIQKLVRNKRVMRVEKREE